MNKNFHNTAINTDFLNSRSFFEFKNIVKKTLCPNDIQTTIFLNRVIEINDPTEIQKIISAYHDSLVSGHQGRSRTLSSIKKYFSWFGMTKDVKEYISKCAKCEKSKVYRYTGAPLQITTVSWQQPHQFQTLRQSR